MNNSHPFITYLEGMRENRAALAVLRRSLGQPPGDAPETFRYVVPWLPAGAPRWREEAYFLVAALFASHPAASGSGNLGDSFVQVKRKQKDQTAIERRFSALLAAHPDDLPFYLRQAISFLRSEETPVNWHQLLSDVLAWGHPDGYVQKQWARSFWGAHNTEPEE